MGLNKGQINTHIYLFSFRVLFFLMEILCSFETGGHDILVTLKVVVGIRLSD